MKRMNRNNISSNHRTIQKYHHETYQKYRNTKRNNLFHHYFFPAIVFGVFVCTILIYIIVTSNIVSSDNTTSSETIRKSKTESYSILNNGQVDPIITRNIEEEQRNHIDMMVPGVSVLAASRVISSGLPFLVYGTAWKKDDTEQLVADAIRHGFRFIDTACQPKHYNEPGVGKGWTLAANELGLQRDDLFIQTKYTSISGQDPNHIPYDPTNSLEDRVQESLRVSLHNLKTSYLDSWVMHSPERTLDETMVAYRVMEQAVDDGKVLRLGISNCYDYDFFTAIYDMARIKPSVLQNRFYGDSDWDQELRQFCKEHNIWYQSFWTLTANRHALATKEVKKLASLKQLSPQTLLYAYLMSLGYATPLDGTTSIEHMKEDQALVMRMQGGDKIFADDNEIRNFEKLLGF